MGLIVGRRFLPLLFGALRPPPKPPAFPFLNDRKGNKRSFKGKEVPLENPFPIRGGQQDILLLPRSVWAQSGLRPMLSWV